MKNHEIDYGALDALFNTFNKEVTDALISAVGNPTDISYRAAVIDDAYTFCSLIKRATGVESDAEKLAEYWMSKI